MPGFRLIAIALATGVAASAWPGQAEILRFRAVLGGAAGSVVTDSKATGTMAMVVDTDVRRVSVNLSVDGISLDALSHAFVARPIGPVHLHQYGSHEHHGTDVALVLPFPYGPSYRTTARGFSMVLTDHDYTAGSKLVGGTIAFDDFVAALKGGRVVVNVHTDRFEDGEISGTVEAG